MKDQNIKERKPRRLFFKHILRKLFLEDWLLKLVALVITLSLWFGVTGLSTPATKRLVVPLVPNVPNNTEVTNETVSEVEIIVSGDERKLKPLTSSGLTASLDLSAVQPGDREVSLTPENVSVDLPLGVKLDGVIPSRIAVRLEMVEELDLPVKADIDGKPADGFEIYSETVLPQRVRVRGPASFMKTLSVVMTDKISVAGKSGDFTARQVPLGVSNPKTTVFNTVVDVALKIGEKRIERGFTVVVAGTPRKVVSFTLYGPRTLVAKARPDDLKVEIGADGAPHITLPAELQDVVEVRNLKINP